MVPKLYLVTGLRYCLSGWLVASKMLEYNEETSTSTSQRRIKMLNRESLTSLALC